MKVLNLYVRNYLGVKAIQITPEKDVVKISGKNGAGKSAAVSSIWSAIGGKKALPVHPLRNGAKDGEISLDLDKLKVQVKFTGKNAYLEVRTKDGEVVKSPQTILDTLYRVTSFDPQSFMDMRSADRADLLLSLTGKKDEINKLDAAYMTFFDERTIVNRKIRETEVKLQSAVGDEDIEEKSASELMARLEEERKKDDALYDMEKEKNILIMDTEDRRNRIVDINDTITKLNLEKESLVKDIAADEADIQRFTGKIISAPPSQIPAIKEEIATVDTWNAHVRKVKESRALHLEYCGLIDQTKELSEKLKAINDCKADLLSTANLGIKGLSIDAGEILIDGIPFDDLSTRERIIASMHIGASQNPELRVMRIEKGSEIDREGMAVVEKFAEEHDYQVWIECVSDSPDGESIFIEEGTIKESTDGENTTV